MNAWCRKLAYGAFLVILGICIGFVPFHELHADNTFSSGAVNVIEKLYKVAASVIQSQNFKANQTELTTHETNTLLESQYLYLSNIRQGVLEVSGELAKLKSQFAEFESDLKRETENSVEHQDSKNFLATIESLSVELATMTEEGVVRRHQGKFEFKNWTKPDLH